MTEEPLALRIGVVRLRLSPQSDGPCISLHAEDIVSVTGLDAEAAEARKIEEQRARERAERELAERCAAEAQVQMEYARIEAALGQRGALAYYNNRLAGNTLTVGLMGADAQVYYNDANAARNQPAQYARPVMLGGAGYGTVGEVTIKTKWGETHIVYEPLEYIEEIMRKARP